MKLRWRSETRIPFQCFVRDPAPVIRTPPLPLECRIFPFSPLCSPLALQLTSWCSCLPSPFESTTTTRKEGNNSLDMSSSEYASLAAGSARNSLKRTRELFDRSAAAAFLPSTSADVRLYEASQARRLKTQYSYKQHEEKNVTKSSDALVVSTVRDEEKTGFTTTSAGALVRRPADEPKQEQNTTGGILVVSDLILSILYSCA